MVKKIFSVISAIVVLAGSAFVPAGAQDDMLTIKSPDFTHRQRPSVLFPHGDHEQNAHISGCIDCHHVYENHVRLEDVSSEDQPCAGCHGIRASENMPGLRKAFHNACKGCHLETAKGPVMCGQCHKRK